MSNDVPSTVRATLLGNPRNGPRDVRSGPEGGRSAHGRALSRAEAGCGVHRHRPARLRRCGLGARDDPAHERRVAVLRCGGRNGCARVRPDRDRNGLLDRQGVGLPHQPGCDVRARRHEAVSVERRAGVLDRAGCRRDRRCARDLGVVRQPCVRLRRRLRRRRLQPRRHELGLGDVRRRRSGPAILLFAILGIVDTRSPEGWAGLVIGLTVVAIIITVGPLTNASINPARALGPLLVSDLNGSFHNWTEQLLAYIPANLAGAAIAAFAYDWVATPRIVERPIRAAVTEPDRADAYETPAHV